jgi:UDP-N-acetylmuramate--alanine ligase
MEEFARSFNQAEAVYLLDIYPASEKPIVGVTATALAQRMREFGHRNVRYVGSAEHAVEAVMQDACEGDVVMTLGAGSVWHAGDMLLERLRAGSHAA